MNNLTFRSRKIKDLKNADTLPSTKTEEPYLNAINKIVDFRETWNIVKCMPEAIKSLTLINETNLRTCLGYELIGEEKRVKFVEIMVDFLKHAYENLNESISRQNQIMSNNDHEGINRIQGLYQFTLIMWNWADKSSEFCIKLVLHFRKIENMILNTTKLKRFI